MQGLEHSTHPDGATCQIRDPMVVLCWHSKNATGPKDGPEKQEKTSIARKMLPFQGDQQAGRFAQGSCSVFPTRRCTNNAIACGMVGTAH